MKAHHPINIKVSWLCILIFTLCIKNILASELQFLSEEKSLSNTTNSLTINSNSQPSYGDFDLLPYDLIRHYITDTALIKVNRSFFTLITGYLPEHILYEGLEHRPTFLGCQLFENRSLNFQILAMDSKNIEHIPSFVWYHLITKVEGISFQYWPYLKGTQILVVDSSYQRIEAVRAHEFALQGTQVQIVNLEGNKIGDTCVYKFGQALQGTQVQSIDLSTNKIGDVGARELGLALQGTQVRIVDLRGNKIGNMGASQFGKALQKTQVQNVKLSYNYITGVGARKFGKALQGTQVRCIDLSSNQLNYMGVEFGEALIKTNIQTIYLGSNILNQQQTIKDIKHICPRIDLKFCNRVYYVID